LLALYFTACGNIALFYHLSTKLSTNWCEQNTPNTFFRQPPKS
jgi:hypothetical protein